MFTVVHEGAKQWEAGNNHPESEVVTREYGREVEFSKV
jgi:hypothetical protein